MASRPANAGSDSAGPDRAYYREPAGAAAPPPMHHQDLSRSLQSAARHRAASAVRPGGTPQDPPGPRPQDLGEYRPPDRPGPRPRDRREDRPQLRAGARPAGPRRPRATAEPAAAEAHVLAWPPYLIVLAGAAAGLFIAWQGSRHAALGTGLVGGALLAAAVARLLLPPRYTGLLSSRHKAPDVAGFAVFGAAVLVIALVLP